MRVRFEFNTDDLIEVGEKSLAESRVVRRIRLGGLVSSSLLGALLGYALPADSGSRPFVVLGTALLCGLAYPALRKATMQRRLRAFWRERLGGDGPFVCEVELSEQGVTTEQFGTRSTRPWSAVAAFEETDASVNISTREGGWILVRDRAFSSPDEKKRFVELGRTLLARG
jgi:YcxB-like protein